nr:aspartic and glutamic acid-rich protein isoform X2 [Nothobranchius furzeri]
MERKRSWEKSSCAEEEEEKEEQVEQKHEAGKDSQTTSYTYDDDEEKDDYEDYEYGDDDGKDGMGFSEDDDDDDGNDDPPSDHDYGDDDDAEDDDGDPPDHDFSDDDDDDPSDHGFEVDDDGREDWGEVNNDEEDEDDDDGDEEDWEGNHHFDGDYKKKDEGHHNQVSPGETPGLWSITCGAKNGLLDIERLKQGEKCIESEGRWFIPPAFENFGGKGTAKKWKATISHKGKSLQFWFKKGLLSTKGYKGWGAKPRKVSEKQQHGGEVPTEESEKLSSKNGDDDEGGKGTGVTKQFIKKEEEKKIDDRGEGKNVTSVDAAGIKQEDKLVQREMGDEDKPADHSLSKAPDKTALQTRMMEMSTAFPLSHGQIISKVQPVKTEEDNYIPVSKKSKQPFATENVNTGANVAPQQLPINQDLRETRSISPPPNFACDCKFKSCSDATKDGHKAAHLLMTSEKCQTLTGSSNTRDTLLSSSSADTKVHAVDLKQLKTEKIKQQLKALKAQEMHYIETTYMQLKALKAQEEFYRRTMKMQLKAIKAQEEYYISKLKDLEDRR